MNKTTKYAANGAILIGILNAIINAFKQLNRMDQDPSLEFDWSKFFLAVGKGALVGAAGGAVVGAVVDYRNSQIKPVDTDKQMAILTDMMKLDKRDPAYLKLDSKAVQLVNLLSKEYGDWIQSMPRLGSTVAGTALRERFDIDFSINFRPGSFTSTEEMFHSVLGFLERQVGKASIIRVRDQRKSVGVFVNVEGTEHRIDIVPCKLTKGANGSGYLYVNPKSLFEVPTYTKTNVRILNSTRLSPTQQRIAIALKKWKEMNDLPLSSHLLQLLILDAYKYSPRIPKGLTAKVIMVLNHIAAQLDVAVIRGKENSNNVVTDIPESDKTAVMQAARNTVQEYNYQPNSIISMIA